MKRSAQLLNFHHFEGLKDTDHSSSADFFLPFCTVCLRLCAVIVALWPTSIQFRRDKYNIRWNRRLSWWRWIFHGMLTWRSASQPGFPGSGKKVARFYRLPALPIVLGFGRFGEKVLHSVLLTTDHSGLKIYFPESSPGMPGWRYCNPGLATAVNRIRTSKAKSKVIILLTSMGGIILERLLLLQGRNCQNILEYGSIAIGVWTGDLHDIRCKVPFWYSIHQYGSENRWRSTETNCIWTGGKYFPS